MERLLEAREAVEYLANKWGRPYSMTAFKTLRHRINKAAERDEKPENMLLPAMSSTNATFWRIEDLDRIEEPDRGKPRGPRKKEGGSTENAFSVMLLAKVTTGRPHPSKRPVVTTRAR